MPTRREKRALKLPKLENPTANIGDRQIGQNQQMLRFLDLRPRAILVRGFAEDSLNNRMK